VDFLGEPDEALERSSFPANTSSAPAILTAMPERYTYRLPVKADWNLSLAANAFTIGLMHETDQSLAESAVRQHRLDLARNAFREFYAQCFWSYREDAEITEAKIPFVIRRLREHGGLAGYRVAAELCR
jgi:hypothetical protein